MSFSSFHKSALLVAVLAGVGAGLRSSAKSTNGADGSLGCADDAWTPDCHQPLTDPTDHLLQFLVRMAGYSYCDFWDVEDGDIDPEDGEEYLGVLAHKVQKQWMSVCTDYVEPKQREVCQGVAVAPGEPELSGNLLYYPLRIMGPGRAVLIYVFRGSRQFDFRDWNTDLSDPCPREVDPQTFEYVDKEAAVKRECPNVANDIGLRVMGSIATSYREGLRDKVRSNLKAFMAEHPNVPIHIIMMGHSLGGGLSQIATFDIAQSGLLDEFRGRFWLTPVPLNPPRVLGKRAAQSTWEKLASFHEETTKKHGDPLFKYFGLGLDWRGFALWDQEDPVTIIPTSSILDFMDSEVARSSVTSLDVMARESALYPMTCPATVNDYYEITKRTNSDMIVRLYTETGELAPWATGAVKLTPRTLLKASWSQFWYMPQPLRVEEQKDWLVRSQMSGHVIAAGVYLRGFAMRSIAEDNRLVNALGVVGSECPAPRPRCGCPFRRHQDPLVVRLRERSHWCRLQRSNKPEKFLKVICNTRDEHKAQYFALHGHCTDESSFASIKLSALDPGRSLLPCRPDPKLGLYCSEHLGPLLKMELVSVGVDHKMSIRLLTHPWETPSSPRYCRNPLIGKIVCNVTDKKKADVFQARAYPELAEGEWLKSKVEELDGHVTVPREVVEHWKQLFQL